MSTALMLGAQVSPAALNHDSNAAVTVIDDASTFTIDNGIVTAPQRSRDTVKIHGLPMA
jgi:hypothetical protein